MYFCWTREDICSIVDVVLDTKMTDVILSEVLSIGRCFIKKLLAEFYNFKLILLSVLPVGSGLFINETLFYPVSIKTKLTERFRPGSAAVISQNVSLFTTGHQIAYFPLNDSALAAY